MELGWSRTPAGRTTAVCGPLAADEIAMPAKEGLGPRQEGGPERTREDAADGGEEDAIGVLPGWSVDLALEEAELVAEGENLGTELGVGVTAEDQDLEEESDDGVGQRAELTSQRRRRCRNRGRAGRREVTGLG